MHVHHARTLPSLPQQLLSTTTCDSLGLSSPEVVEHLPNALALVQFVYNWILYSLVLKAVEVFQVVYGEGKVLDSCIATQIKAAQSLQLVQTGGYAIQLVLLDEQCLKLGKQE